MEARLVLIEDAAAAVGYSVQLVERLCEEGIVSNEREFDILRVDLNELRAYKRDIDALMRGEES